VLRSVAGASNSAAGSIVANWKQITLATAAAGAILQKWATVQAEASQTLRRTGAIAGVAEKEIRALAAGMVDASTSSKESIALLEAAAKAGMRGAAELKQFAAFWDLIGDATGENSAALAESSVVLQVWGADLRNLSRDVLPAFDYIVKNTSVGIQGFLEFTQLAGPRLREMGLNAEQAAILIGALERRGIRGRAVMVLLGKALEESGGNLSAFMKAVGVTNSELGEQAAILQRSAGAIQKLGDQYDAGKTAMERFAAAADRVSLKYGTLSKEAGNLAVVLIALGPIVKGASWLFTSLFTKAGFLAVALTKLWTGLVALIAGAVAAVGAPIVLLIAALAGAVWAVNTYFEEIQAALAPFADWLYKWGAQTWGALSVMQDAARQAVTALRDEIAALWDGILSGDALEAFKARVRNLVEFVRQSAAAVRGALAGNESGGAIADPSAADRYRTSPMVYPVRSASAPAPAGVTLNQRGLFDGANISMRTESDARRLSEQIYGLARSRFRASGVVV
jgi:hypothetical protein